MPQFLAVWQVNAAVAARALASQKRGAPIADDIEDAEGARVSARI